MGRRLIGALAATLAVALLAPAVGAAQTPLPVGEAEGVRIERRTGAVVFTKEAVPLWRRIAGRRAPAGGGFALPPPRLLPRLAGETDGPAERRANRARPAADRVHSAHPEGAVFLDEQVKAFALLGLITIARFRG